MNKILTYLLVLYFKRNSCYFTVYKNDYFWAKKKFITFLCKLRGIRDHKHCLNKVCVYVLSRSFQQKIFFRALQFQLNINYFTSENFFFAPPKDLYLSSHLWKSFYFIFQYYPKLSPISNIQHHKRPCYNLSAIGCLEIMDK